MYRLNENNFSFGFFPPHLGRRYPEISQEYNDFNLARTLCLWVYSRPHKHKVYQKGLKLRVSFNDEK